MEDLLKLSRAIDYVNDRFGEFANWLVRLACLISAGNAASRYLFSASGLPPEKWSSLMYGLWPDGGLKNGKEATHCGRDRHEAAAG